MFGRTSMAANKTVRQPLKSLSTRQETPATKEIHMFNGRGHFGMLVIGVGIGLAVGLLVAPCSGEEAREWLTETAEDQLKRVRRQGRRLVFQAQDILERSQDSVSKMLKNSKSALDTVADRLA